LFPVFKLESQGHLGHSIAQGAFEVQRMETLMLKIGERERECMRKRELDKKATLQ
jgi:hypothetical protein